MAETVNTAVVIEDDIAVRAKQKKELLFNFYENIMKGGEILSVEDLDIAMESLKLAQLDLKEREKRKLQEREAELLKQKMAEEEKRRRMAEGRAAKRAERKRKERAVQISAMELPLDYVNQYDDDARAIKADMIRDYKSELYSTCFLFFQLIFMYSKHPRIYIVGRWQFGVVARFLFSLMSVEIDPKLLVTQLCVANCVTHHKILRNRIEKRP